MSKRHQPGTPDPDKAATTDDANAAPFARGAPLSRGLENLLMAIQGRRILIVEDEILVAGELADDIEELGGDVVGPAYSVAEGRHLSQSADIDAAILDINLNGQKVYPVSDVLDRRGIPFIFHTGTVKGPVALKLYGGVPVVSKPSLTIDLLRALLSVLDR